MSGKNFQKNMCYIRGSISYSLSISRITSTLSLFACTKRDDKLLVTKISMFYLYLYFTLMNFNLW